MDTKVGDLINLETDELNNALIFSGFMKPGIHSIIVYDPIKNKFYHKQIVV